MIHKIFEQVASRHAGRIALSYKGRDVTYAELDAWANALARRLGALAVRPGDVVAVSLSHSVELAVAFLGILKCGAAYLPLDIANPPQRNLQFLQAAKVNVIVGSQELDEAHVHGRTALRVSDCPVSTTSFESFASDPEDKAYVMFTSGSTGTPKGVVIPHRGVTRLVRSTNYVSIEQDDRILQLAPPSFDASTFEIWGALLNGATLVPYSGSVLDPNRLKNDIQENRISILWLTAALFHLVADKAIDALKPLRVLLAGGDVLNARYVSKVLESAPGITVINGYGPTENTTFTCCHVMTSENKPTVSVPIGKPISGTCVHILDDLRSPVPRGTVGELYASGDGVALGYLNEREGGASFFSDETVASGLIYRTGDLVKEEAHGELQFIGRRDNLVKVRGYRVSLEEVRTHILGVEDVIDAIVARKELPQGEQTLVAYVSRREGGSVDAGAIRRRLLECIPRYMIPDRFVFDRPMTINDNGKLDRASIAGASNPGKGSEHIGQEQPGSTDYQRDLPTEGVLGGHR